MIAREGGAFTADTYIDPDKDLCVFPLEKRCNRLVDQEL